MMLGDLVARFDDEVVAAETLLSLGDIGLTARVREAAAQEGLSAGEYASCAVQEYSAAATDEEWVTVIGQIGRSDEPGLVLLRRSLMWALMRNPVGNA